MLREKLMHGLKLACRCKQACLVVVAVVVILLFGGHGILTLISVMLIVDSIFRWNDD